PLKTWIPMHNSFLNEMLWVEGPGYALGTSGGPDCEAPGQSSMICCEECFRGGIGVPIMLAINCHKLLLKWNGQSFESTSLKDLGLIIQLGHPNVLCPNLKAGPGSFIMIHTNGLHLLNIHFCDCLQAVLPYQQLLHSCWFHLMHPQKSTP
ncbi:hypothetical protein BS47DRAFT_1294741, partial [Hydnum rufescens UP504]